MNTIFACLCLHFAYHRWYPLQKLQIFQKLIHFYTHRCRWITLNTIMVAVSAMFEHILGCGKKIFNLFKKKCLCTILSNSCSGINTWYIWLCQCIVDVHIRKRDLSRNTETDVTHPLEYKKLYHSVQSLSGKWTDTSWCCSFYERKSMVGKY